MSMTVSSFDGEAVSQLSDMMTPDVHDCLIEWGEREFKNIAKERKMNRNFPFAFINIGDFGEELAGHMYPESIGSGSKGGCSHDNRIIDPETYTTVFAREVKTVSLNGTKKCSDCGNKAPSFQLSCTFCKGSNFIAIKDSRAGISAKAHIEYMDVLKETIIFVSDYIEENEIINLKCFKFLNDNDYFYRYVHNQHVNSKQNNCNFIPYSYDWYLSGPIMLFDINIQRTGTLDVKKYDLSNDEPCDIPRCVFKSNEIIEHQILNEYTKYRDNFPLRMKNLNKKRGVTTRK